MYTQNPAEIAQSITRNTIMGFEIIGFKVICVTSENNEINRKAMSQFWFVPETVYYLSSSQPPYSTVIFFA